MCHFRPLKLEGRNPSSFIRTSILEVDVLLSKLSGKRRYEYTSLNVRNNV